MALQMYHLNVCVVFVLEREGAFGTFPHRLADSAEGYVHSILHDGFGDGGGDVDDLSRADMRRMLSAACAKYNAATRMLRVIRGDYEDVVDKENEALYEDCSLAEATKLMTRGSWADGNDKWAHAIMLWKLACH
jgi:hypothetical protein